MRKADPILGAIIDRVGECRIKLREAPFSMLVEAIIYQQLAMTAARAISHRFRALYPNNLPTPHALLKTPDEKLRAVGLSSKKVLYMKDLAEKRLKGAVRFNDFRRMGDEEIIANLTQVKGIGRWTAEMFLIFCLGRLDVLPVDDLGFRKAVQNTYHLTEPPKPETLRRLAEPWRPYRSIATWYFWRSRENPG